MEDVIQHIKDKIEIDKIEEGLIRSKFFKKSFTKRRFLLREGETCRQLSYVNKGCLRVYSVDENGYEKTVFFTIEDWWVVDLKSFIEQSPARFFIDAIEDSELWQITKSDFDELLHQIPQMEKWFRILLQNALVASENRINYKSALIAEERYLKFIDKYPLLESRIAQKHIASYLGISPEFLSKLKAERWKRQKS